MKTQNFLLMDYLVRLRGNLTQREFAKKVGMSESAYVKLERGYRNITFSLAYQIGAFCGIHPHEILKLDPEYQELIAKVEQIDPQTKK